MIDSLLQVDFWDVGQGDCTVIRLPSGKLIIIDVGPVGSPLVDWLNERHPPLPIEAIVLTHNDADHAGALASIVKPHGTRIGSIRMLLDRDRDSQQFQKIFRAAKEGVDRGLYPLDRLERGTILWSHHETETHLRVVHPSFVENVEATNPNDTSAVLVLTSGPKTLIAWPGDLEIRQTARVLGNVDATLLFGPHHGGPTDYPTKAVRKRNPELMVSRMREIREAVASLSPVRSFISVGTKNPYHHPRPGFIKLLARNETRVTCSQLTLCCDRHHVQAGQHVFPGAGVLGLRPARSGVSCRGAMRYYVHNGALLPDEFAAEHRTRVAQLLRPQCLRR